MKKKVIFSVLCCAKKKVIFIVQPFLELWAPFFRWSYKKKHVYGRKQLRMSDSEVASRPRETH